MGEANQLLLRAGLERANRRNHFDARHDRIVGLAVGHALRDPAAQELVRHRIDFHPLAAAVRNQAGRLLQNQAAIGRGGRKPAAAPFFHQMLVIFAGHEAQERQRKPFCPLALPWQPPALQPSLVKIGTI